MSRRRARFRQELADLRAALSEVGVLSDQSVETQRRHACRSLDRFLLPRLGEPSLPLVVALIGSTGAGKSTLLNSVARRLVSPPGVLRPTTDEVVVWTAPRYADALGGLGRLVLDDHPLAQAVALIDAPDLDSDLADHQAGALEAAESADALIVVTTAARYGDAVPWEVLGGVVRRRMAVVLNRLPTRGRGARLDLMARLRQHSHSEVPVLTISEQLVNEGRLPRQAVQRLGSLLREWGADAGTIRTEAFERAADRTAADLKMVEEAVTSRLALRPRLAEIARGCHLEAAEELVGIGHRRRHWWGRARPAHLPEQQIRSSLVDAARQTRRMAALAGIGAIIDLSIPDVALAGQVPSTREALWGLFESEAERLVRALIPWPDEITERLRSGIGALDYNDYPDE